MLTITVNDPELREKNVAQAGEIKRLQDILFSIGAMKDAPCFCCGYNGPDYYNPAVHPCAKRHHSAQKKGVIPC